MKRGAMKRRARYREGPLHIAHSSHELTSSHRAGRGGGAADRAAGWSSCRRLGELEPRCSSRACSHPPFMHTTHDPHARRARTPHTARISHMRRPPVPPPHEGRMHPKHASSSMRRMPCCTKRACPAPTWHHRRTAMPCPDWREAEASGTCAAPRAVCVLTPRRHQYRR